MTSKKISINNIPAIIWGEKAEKVYIYIHGKMSNKENAEEFAKLLIVRDIKPLALICLSMGKEQIKAINVIFGMELQI